MFSKDILKLVDSSTATQSFLRQALPRPGPWQFKHWVRVTLQSPVSRLGPTCNHHHHHCHHQDFYHLHSIAHIMISFDNQQQALLLWPDMICRPNRSRVSIDFLQGAVGEQGHDGFHAKAILRTIIQLTELSRGRPEEAQMRITRCQV